MTNPEYPELNLEKEIIQEECAFFGISDLKSTGTQEFFRVYPSLREKGQIIEASEHFVLIPDIAPITQDHLLLVPKEHLPSFASIPQFVDKELRLLIARTIDRMKQFHPHSEIIGFEHGVGTIDGQTIQCGGCGRTDHAHLHILPVFNNEDNGIGVKVAEIISQNFKLISKEVAPLPELNINAATAKLPYLYLWSDRLNHSLAFVQNSAGITIPSQLIRKLLAVEISGVREEEQDRWDWRDYIIFHSRQGGQIISDTLNRWIPKAK